MTYGIRNGLKTNEGNPPEASQKTRSTRKSVSMSYHRSEAFVPYKFQSLKVYCSAEWLANEKKKYRRVFDRSETAYIYGELSFYNKLFDEQDWRAKVTLKVFAVRGNQKKELGSRSSDEYVSRNINIVKVHQAWGDKKQNVYWRKGTYQWEAYVNGRLIGSRKFWIEEIGQVTDDNNPYFNIEAIKLYEGPSNNINLDQRVYLKGLDSNQTRYIFTEFTFQNLVTTAPWQCELFFRFYNDTHQLKGETIEMLTVNPQSGSQFVVTSGWGSNERGTWFPHEYTLKVLFMDKLIAILPFEVGDTFEKGMNEVLLPGTGTKLIPQNQTEAENFEEVMVDLESLIGLQTVKNRIKEYAEYLKFIKLRIEKGFEDAKKINLNAIFLGNPGTGKTTVAQMLGKIYKHMGLLSKGHIHEVDRADLVGEYIGQTAPKVKEAIKQAKGGILFIDEAYSLARTKGDSKDFGREVIEILVKEMSNGTGDMAIIVAGYPQEMRTFIESNPGLQSRFNQWFEFPDYLPQELADIAEYATQQRNVLMSMQGKAYLYDKIVEAYRTRDRFFGNARHINNLIDEAKVNLGLRVMKQVDNPQQLTKEELSTIEVSDFERIFKGKEKQRPDIPIDENMLKAALKELSGLVGLAQVKKDIEELVNLVRFYREMNKDVLNRFSLHSVFTGNPGTGKTTVARILAQIFKALGVLERGHLVETDRQGLVAGFVGQTAIKAAQKIDEAIGGVLFIDEAYALTPKGGNDYGREAIETILKRMEDQQGEFAVVVAGYPENMKKFLDSNPGLQSRFDRVLDFKNFEVTELMEIVSYHLIKENLTITPKAEQHLRKYFQYLAMTEDKFFGNGRKVVKTMNGVIKNQNLRLARTPSEQRNEEMLRTITFKDVEHLDEALAFKGKRKKLGFRNVPGSA